MDDFRPIYRAIILLVIFAIVAYKFMTGKHELVNIPDIPDEDENDEYWSNSSIIKSYAGSVQQYEFQADLNALQEAGLHPDIRRGNITSIALHNSEFERGCEILGIGEEASSDEIT